MHPLARLQETPPRRLPSANERVWREARDRHWDTIRLNHWVQTGRWLPLRPPSERGGNNKGPAPVRRAREQELTPQELLRRLKEKMYGHT